MEHGFFHPDRGYWQAIGDVPDDVLSTYPEGTVEVPLKPSANHEWNGTAWVEVLSDPAAILADWRENGSIPRAEFCVNANAMGLLVDADAEKAAAGAWPDAFEPIIATWPLADRIRARAKWADNPLIYRSDPLLALLAGATGLTAQQIDVLCGWTG